MWGERDNKLPPGTPIGSWSSTLDNVSWSKDNIIAVGGGEDVTLLVCELHSLEQVHVMLTISRLRGIDLLSPRIGTGIDSTSASITSPTKKYHLCCL